MFENKIESKVLILSSTLFIYPTYYAYTNGMMILSLLYFLSGLISINYWRNPIKSWRLDIDLIYSKSMLVLSCYNGAKYITRTNQLLLSYPGFILTIYSYNKSTELHIIKNNNWYKYHCMMHIIMIYESLIILYNIKHANIYGINSNFKIILYLICELIVAGIFHINFDNNRVKICSN